MYMCVKGKRHLVTILGRQNKMLCNLSEKKNSTVHFFCLSSVIHEPEFRRVTAVSASWTTMITVLCFCLATGYHRYGLILVCFQLSESS